MSEKNPPAKRRFYQNVLDAYRLTARTYPALPWILLGAAALVIAVFMLLAFLTNTSWIGWLVIGIMGSITAALAILSFLARRALYAQVEETAGAVKVALSQIQRGWIIPEQPVAFTREQDLVWRIVGRPGVVLISEGPASRVRPLLQSEAKRVTKVMRNVPVHQIQVGREDGQTALKDLQRALRGLKNVLTAEEVPQVSARINALRSNEPPIPKGIDPLRARASRRARRSWSGMSGLMRKPIVSTGREARASTSSRARPMRISAASTRSAAGTIHVISSPSLMLASKVCHSPGLKGQAQIGSVHTCSVICPAARMRSWMLPRTVK